MHVSFGNAAYVSGTSKESIEEYLEKYKNMSNYDRVQNRSVGEYLIKALETINEKNNDSPIGDIFFTT